MSGGGDTAADGAEPVDGQHVVLLGDSTIDNLVWVGYESSVPVKLEACLRGWKITNYAADGFTSNHMVKGAMPAISMDARDRAGCALPVSKKGWIFKPLDAIRELSIKPTHAVLSVGGNDVREVLKRMAQLPSQMRLFLSNYVKITESVLEALQSPRLVLMLQYRPCINTDKKFYGVYAALGSLPLRHEGGVMAVMNGLMEAVYPAILALARRKGLPVIDLPRSFDPHDEDLYDHQIEPAAKGSDVIAGLVAHTLQHHQWGGPSMFYFRAPGSDKVTAEENREGEKWRVDPEVPGPDLSAFMGSVGA